MRTARLSASILLACLLAFAAPAGAGDEPPSVRAEVAAYFRATSAVERTTVALRLAVRGAKPAAVLAAVPDAVAGRPASDDETGAGHIVGWKRETTGGQVHTIFARGPAGYDPSRAWPVLIWLHGGVNGERDGMGAPAANALGERADTHGFFVLAPSTYGKTPWWSPAGVALVRGALEDAKARWHIDANRVYVAGFSDGGSGCYHLLAHDPEPYAAFLPMMGHPVWTRLLGGPTYAANISSRPVFAVNGGKDRLYPSSAVKPLIDGLKRAGCDITWTDLPEAGHSLNHLAEVWDALWAFARAHPRRPATAAKQLACHDPRQGGRLDWIEIVQVDKHAPGDAELAPQELGVPRRVVLGVRLDLAFGGPGLRVASVEDATGAAEAGVLAGDVITKVGETELGAQAEAVAALRAALTVGAERSKRTLAITVERDDGELVLEVVARVPGAAARPRPAALGYDVPTGQVSARRETRSRISIATYHVAALRLHLSAELVDLDKPLEVIVNGHLEFRGLLKPRVGYTLAEAARSLGAAPHNVVPLLIRIDAK